MHIVPQNCSWNRQSHETYHYKNSHYDCSSNNLGLIIKILGDTLEHGCYILLTYRNFLVTVMFVTHRDSFLKSANINCLASRSNLDSWRSEERRVGKECRSR